MNNSHLYGRTKSSIHQQSCAYRIRDDGFVEIYDLDFAAYCSRVRGEMLIEIAQDKTSSHNTSNIQKSVFIFNMARKQIGQLSIDYNNSESSRHADGVRSLKKAIRSSLHKGS